MAVGLMLLGQLTGIGITACICWVIYLLTQNAQAQVYLFPAVLAVGAMVIRYIATRLSGGVRDTLGRQVKKDLRKKIYNKILCLGVRTADEMSMAGLTQVSMEGV